MAKGQTREEVTLVVIAVVRLALAHLSLSIEQYELPNL